MPIARWWSSNGSHGLDFAAVCRRFSFAEWNTPNDTTLKSSPGSEGHPGGKPTRPATKPLHTPRGSGVRRVGELPQRFASKFAVDEATGCWNWIAYISAYGYGRYRPDRYHMELAHRFAYEQLVGPIPVGMQLDHLCRNRACVNPAHLEPVTNFENHRRGSRATATHCNHGHELTPENTYTFPHEKWRHRACRICRKRRDDERYALKRDGRTA